jgi:hypothetical protein
VDRENGKVRDPKQEVVHLVLTIHVPLGYRPAALRSTPRPGFATSERASVLDHSILAYTHHPLGRRRKRIPCHSPIRLLC